MRWPVQFDLWHSCFYALCPCPPLPTRVWAAVGHVALQTHMFPGLWICPGLSGCLTNHLTAAIWHTLPGGTGGSITMLVTGRRGRDEVGLRSLSWPAPITNAPFGIRGPELEPDLCQASIEWPRPPWARVSTNVKMGLIIIPLRSCCRDELRWTWLRLVTVRHMWASGLLKSTLASAVRGSPGHLWEIQLIYGDWTPGTRGTTF